MSRIRNMKQKFRLFRSFIWFRPLFNAITRSSPKAGIEANVLHSMMPMTVNILVNPKIPKYLFYLALYCLYPTSPRFTFPYAHRNSRSFA